MALTAAEREAIERLSRVARGEADHEFYDDRPTADDDYAANPSAYDFPPALTGVWAAEADRLAALVNGKN